MRKHGWELPYHPLQVVAVAVFLALGFAFYVFFAPFVGRKMFQYIAMGIYTPLIMCAFGLYIWCAASDPADPGVFRSKKYLNIPENEKHPQHKGSKQGIESASSMHDGNSTIGGKSGVEGGPDAASKNETESKPSCLLLALSPCAAVCSNVCVSSDKHSEQMSEDGMFYCSLCEVEWINNCIGKKNYRKFFSLMVSALLLLIFQWATGILVLVCCFVERKRFVADIATKLGSSFSLVPYVIVVAVCTILAMIATLPLAQLFFFHILLIKKGISTYDYIIALREQEQEQQGIGGQQSPQMSQVSSITGLSSASSFSTFHRGAWCTPPRLFLEDQFDVVPPDTGSVSSYGKKTMREEPIKKKNPAAVKISPWTLAKLNADEVSKAAAEARKKSKILQPVTRQEPSYQLERDNSFGSNGHRMVPRLDNNRRRASKRIRLPADLPMESATVGVSGGAPGKGFTETSSSLAPLQLEARSAFQPSRTMAAGSVGVVASSPESSLDSPDIHPFRVSSSGAEESRRLTGLPPIVGCGPSSNSGFPLSRSTSDGYEASGGEDSDRVPTRIVQRSTNWSNLLFRANQDESIMRLKAASSSSQPNSGKL
ncbi:Probable protein S-acyltransferase 22 [Linum perenne]